MLCKKRPPDSALRLGPLNQSTLGMVYFDELVGLHRRGQLDTSESLGDPGTLVAGLTMPETAESVCQSTVSTFDRQDEDELEMVTSECLNGMCFLASK